MTEAEILHFKKLEKKTEHYTKPKVLRKLKEDVMIIKRGDKKWKKY